MNGENLNCNQIATDFFFFISIYKHTLLHGYEERKALERVYLPAVIAYNENRIQITADKREKCKHNL